jgi:hypothetical protein
MLIFISAAALFVLVRTVRAAMESLRSLPRSNQDWIWY